MSRLAPLVLALVAACALALPAPAVESGWEVETGHEETTVTFRSKATLETFEGRTNELSGTATLDPADLGTLRAELELDLASLDTGIGLRNRHMRENVLHTGEHPVATLTIDRSEGGLLVAGKPVETRVGGTLELHGVTQPFDEIVRITLRGPDELRFSCDFEVALGDFGIERPKMLMLKVAEVVQLQVEGLARRVDPDPAGDSGR